jgi:hypothetical protein
MPFPRNGYAPHRVEHGRKVKLCRGCDRWLPSDPDHFYRQRAKADGLQSRCIECIRLRMRDAMRKRYALQRQMRQYAQAAIEGRLAA